MFFIMSILQSKKKLDWQQNGICPCCGAFSRFEVYFTYSYLSLFFIPVWKWNKQYYVKMRCCDAVYLLNPEKGNAIREGKSVSIDPEDLTPVQTGSLIKHCANCGYLLDDSFEYCPKCGKKI